jgi:hypothetical protein
MPDLDAKIAEWRSRMAAGGIQTPAVLDELESHLREEIERQMRLGIDELKAFDIAVQKIGGSDLLKAEFAKIGGVREVPIGRVIGTACCVAAALYSLALTPALVMVPELGSGQRFSGLTAVSLTLLFLVSLRFSYKYLPVIRSRRARIGWVATCGVAAVVWLVIFCNLLPDVIVPRQLGDTILETQVLDAGAPGFEAQRNSLLVHNRTYVDTLPRNTQPGLADSQVATAAVFDAGVSLFWAMTFAAALGGVASGLEEAARRRAKENVYV